MPYILIFKIDTSLVGIERINKFKSFQTGTYLEFGDNKDAHLNHDESGSGLNFAGILLVPMENFCL